MSKPKSVREAEDVVARCMADLGIRYPETLSAIIELSEAYRTSGDLDSAQQILEEAASDYGTWDGKQDYPIQRVVLQLSVVLANQGLNLAAKAIQEEVLAAWKFDLGRGDWETIRAMNVLIETLAELGEFAPALSLGLEALDAVQLLAGVESKESEKQMRHNALVRRKMGDYPSADLTDKTSINVAEKRRQAPEGSHRSMAGRLTAQSRTKPLRPRVGRGLNPG